jgi:hypothetical protein
MSVTAEDEVRAAALCCPSCGGNLADLMRTGHRLYLAAPAPGLRFGLAGCRDGQPAELDTIAKAQAAYNIVAAESWLWDVGIDQTPLAGRSPLSMDFPAS